MYRFINKYRNIKYMKNIEITKYEKKYLDSLLKFNNLKKINEKDFSNYLLLTLENNIFMQLSITKCRDFYRFLDLKILDGVEKLTYQIGDFIQYAINQVKSDCKEISAFVAKNETELKDIYERNGFELDEEHPFNQMERNLGYVFKKNCD